MYEILIAAIFFATLLMSVCIPLIPAVLIYRLFPDTKVGLSGPLKGLTVKTGGAFAAYLITLLVVFPLINKTYDIVGGFSKPYWTITLPISLHDKSGKKIEIDQSTQELPVEVSFSPERDSLTPQRVSVIIPGYQPEDNLSLTILIEDFGSAQINLDNYKDLATIDSFRKTQVLDVPIVIQENARAREVYHENKYIN